jgi:uncharacterized protein YdeI (YjbR/CyaY-like superfamily)
MRARRAPMTKQASAARRREPAGRTPARSPGAARSFTGAASFRAWLQRHHGSTSELIVRCFKTSAATRGLTYSDALDEALAFGWIDGVRRGVDAISFSVRFTPRKAKSIWSRVNVRRVEALKAAGRMAAAGLAAYAARDESRTAVYSFEREAARFPATFTRRFKANRVAWAYFADEAPWYCRSCTHWVMSAKKEETRQRRLDTLIDCSASGVRIGPLRR